MSIYTHTLARLHKWIGLSPHVLRDKNLALLFVQLERAARTFDFDIVLQALSRLQVHLQAQGKEHLIIYGYMYVRGDGITTTKISHQTEADGQHTVTYTFSRKLLADEFLIREWATRMCHLHSHYLRRATQEVNGERKNG